jgi:hypothetical protein
LTIPPTDSDPRLCPVFIVGFPRTGTTLLYRILCRHSAFYPQICEARSGYNPIIETHFDRWFFQYSVDLWCLEDNNSPRQWFAGSSAAYTSFLLDCFRAFHLHAATARGCPRILEKTPSHIFLCEFMVRAFPNARILCLRRDPADTVASFRRRRAMQAGSDGEWLDLANDLDSFIRCWNQNTAAWSEFITHFPNHGRTVDYFQLTTKPFATVVEVFRFIGEEMEPHILEGSAPLEPLEWLDRYDSHIPVSNNEVWGNYVTENDATRLRTECIPVRDAAL